MPQSRVSLGDRMLLDPTSSVPVRWLHSPSFYKRANSIALLIHFLNGRRMEPAQLSSPTACAL